jgi:phosphatidylinositol glycan class V
MLWLLSTTSISVLRGLLRPSIPEGNDHSPDMVNPSATKLEFCQFPQLAIPQLVLTVAAATNFHVQIINRISSGYPLWYLVVAKWVTDRAASDGVAEADAYAQRTIRGMVVYTIIQGLLFASFLPPA